MDCNKQDPKSNQATAKQRQGRLWHNGLSIRTFGRLQTLPGGVRLPLALLGASKLGFSPFPAGSGTMGCVLTAFNPDVWPPSNPSRRGTVATGSARGLKTWLFTVSGRLWHNGLCFNAFHSGCLAALKPSPAGYGCHWLQALAQWAVFYRLSIRTFGRPQTLPGGVRLPLALLGASRLGFSPFGQALAHWFGRPQTLPGRVRLHPSATASAGASTGTVRLPLALL